MTHKPTSLIYTSWSPIGPSTSNRDGTRTRTDRLDANPRVERTETCRGCCTVSMEVRVDGHPISSSWSAEVIAQVEALLAKPRAVAA